MKQDLQDQHMLSCGLEKIAMLCQAVWSALHPIDCFVKLCSICFQCTPMIWEYESVLSAHCLLTGCAYMYMIAWIEIQTTQNRQECVCSGFAEKWSCALRFESKLHRNAASCSQIAVPNLCCFCWCRWSSDKMSLPHAALYVGLMYVITVQRSIFLTAAL